MSTPTFYYKCATVQGQRMVYEDDEVHSHDYNHCHEKMSDDHYVFCLISPWETGFVKEDVFKRFWASGLLVFGRSMT